ncbi:MAG TPA: HlyD family efflux transporter periplasmic adaptor subunit [Woeseiaceae bacterium]|nr:HlyD family efflux transporter periplasmic adaptor subunit [Woeseiaceae bacterium]
MRNWHLYLLWLPLGIAAGCNGPDEANRVVGYLESDRVEISAAFDEPITRIAVVEGQAVAKGELLLQQDRSRIEARLAEARAVLDQARARRDELVRGPREEQITAARANAAAAEQQLEFLKLDHARAQRIFEQNLTSREALDRATTALEVGRAELKAREARLSELLEGTTIEELRQAEAAVKAAEAQLAQLEVDLERHGAFAPADGVIDTILFEPGERPRVGDPMLVLLTGDQPHARVYVPETIRVSVVPGTPARVFVDGLADTLEGRVRWVSADAAFTPYYALTERDRGRLSFAAEVDIEDLERRLPDGVPVEVVLLVGADGRP